MSTSKHHATHRALVQSALASALGLGLGLGPAQAHKGQPNQEPCYGVAKAGENHCSNLLGTHECAGDATTDYAIDEWKYVPKGTCKQLKGFTKAEAELRLKQQQQKATQPVPAGKAGPAPAGPAPAPAAKPTP